MATIGQQPSGVMGMRGAVPGPLSGLYRMMVSVCTLQIGQMRWLDGIGGRETRSRPRKQRSGAWLHAIAAQKALDLAGDGGSLEPRYVPQGIIGPRKASTWAVQGFRVPVSIIRWYPWLVSALALGAASIGVRGSERAAGAGLEPMPKVSASPCAQRFQDKTEKSDRG
ncbi:hypothetical protein RF55_24951 [Lasius niger]|uniref:Uncharacterized protein n=1 Tax=Lasius niger TaxID=67767 RepID=A0A0J7JUM4_LASNI|nr:hypothetical protein RF55_24951 [Lasius niger]